MSRRSLNCCCLVGCLFAASSCTPELSPRKPMRDAGERDATARDATVRDASEDAGDAAPDAKRPDPETRRLARNIIVFMGDGMGPEQLETGRIASGGRFRIDSLKGPALAVTDSLTTLRVGGVDPPPTDSAAAATWIATGVRVENDVISQAPDGSPITTVLELCKRVGKATGVVTTSTFFDASPAAFTAHQLSRSFATEIIHDMLTLTQADVIMGNGDWYVDNPENGLTQVVKDAGYHTVRSIPELVVWDPLVHPRLLGMFHTDFLPVATGSELFTMTPALERTERSPDPTLAMMTARAIDRLSRDPDGFFLFSEDEITDEIGHRGPAEVAWANRALPAETMAIDEAVGYAIDWVEAHSSWEETLIVVLADHETGGYHFDPAIGPVSGDFSAFGDDGVIRYGFHTRRPIEVYARGPGSDAVEQIASHGDTYQMLVGQLKH